MHNADRGDFQHRAVRAASAFPAASLVRNSKTAMNQIWQRGVWHLYGEQVRMQELALIQPGSTSRSAADSGGLESEAALRAAFESRLAECGPLAFRVARGVLRNTADAEDVAQEALLRAYRRFHRLRDRDRFRAWLVRITFRLALDCARSARRRALREALWSRPEGIPPAANAEDLAIRRQFEAHLHGALDELPEKLQLVLLLAAMQGNTLEEVAAILRVPMGTVKSRLFFARKQLAEKLRCRVKSLDLR
jgi:RNA polymerase sigma-70 factor (ECF subfamily)